MSTLTENHEIVLEVDSVAAGYEGLVVVRDVSLELRAGGCVAVIGPNGAGKTTLAKAIVSQLPLSGGRVRFCGQSTARQSTDALARKGLIYVPEGRSIFGGLSVAENVRLGAMRGTSRKEQQDTIDAVYARFPRLAERKNQLARTLSGGESRMLALAHVLEIPPKVLVVDELSMGLAPLIVNSIYAQLEEIVAAGVAVLLIEQFVDRALNLATDALVLNHGRVSFYGSTEELRASPERLDYFTSA